MGALVPIGLFGWWAKPQELPDSVQFEHYGLKRYKITWKGSRVHSIVGKIRDTYNFELEISAKSEYYGGSLSQTWSFIHYGNIDTFADIKRILIEEGDLIVEDIMPGYIGCCGTEPPKYLDWEGYSISSTVIPTLKLGKHRPILAAISYHGDSDGGV